MPACRASTAPATRCRSSSTRRRPVVLPPSPAPPGGLLGPASTLHPRSLYTRNAASPVMRPLMATLLLALLAASLSGCASDPAPLPAEEPSEGFRTELFQGSP